MKNINFFHLKISKIILNFKSKFDEFGKNMENVEFDDFEFIQLDQVPFFVLLFSAN